MEWFLRLLPRRWLPPMSPGRRGEELAAKYLRRQGYKVLAHNLRLRIGEIDLVCQAPDGQTIVLVEVKSGVRQPGSNSELRPETHVNLAKQRKLTCLALELTQRWKLADRPVRFDVVGVELPPPPESPHIPEAAPIIRHHIGAFQAQH